MAHNTDLTGTTRSNRLENLPSTPDTKPSSECYDTFVRVRVGDVDGEQTVFHVYKGLFKFYSGFFRAAIDNIETGRFHQDEENTIQLPDEDPELFKKFKSWFFTGQLAEYYDHQNLIELWLIGDRRHIPSLQNAALTNLRDWSVKEQMQPLSELQYVWDNTREGSPLRRYLIFAAARRVFSRTKMFESEWPAEAVMELAKELIQRPEEMSREAFAALDLCQFHVHEVGVRCKR